MILIYLIDKKQFRNSNLNLETNALVKLFVSASEKMKWAWLSVSCGMPRELFGPSQVWNFTLTLFTLLTDLYSNVGAGDNTVTAIQWLLLRQ